METLGEVLRKRREQLGLTLRGIEEKIGISNAYLSQVENEKITHPSPSVLQKLADFYSLSYNRLMKLAGHPVISSNQKTILFRTSAGLEEITKEEEKELLEYLRFLRMRRSKK